MPASVRWRQPVAHCMRMAWGVRVQLTLLPAQLPALAVKKLARLPLTFSDPLGQPVRLHAASVLTYAAAHPRVAAYGTLDELNAMLGLSVCAVAAEGQRTLVIALQERIFWYSAELARLVELGAEVTIRQMLLRYLNRLSDCLYALARSEDHAAHQRRLVTEIAARYLKRAPRKPAWATKKINI